MPEMILDTLRTEIPLGVECAWPASINVRPAGPSLRQRRLAEVWRRLLAVFRSPRRNRWIG
jgi:hypothetical protein